MSETRLPTRPSDPCNPRQLAALLSASLGRQVQCDVSPNRTVVYDDLTPAEVTAANAVIAAYTFDPDFETDPHFKLIRAQHAILTGGLANWDQLTLGQKDTVLKNMLRQLIENFYISEARN
jgi:hypothetical protein